MNEDGDYLPLVPERTDHYHGDEVRVLFLVAAVLIFSARFVDTIPTFTFGATMLLILTLVISAGVTNPVQKWIHMVNMLISIAGSLTYGWLSFSRIETPAQLFSSDGLMAIIALIFLAALYLSTRTVRGFSVPHVAA